MNVNSSHRQMKYCSSRLFSYKGHMEIHRSEILMIQALDYSLENIAPLGWERLRKREGGREGKTEVERRMRERLRERLGREGKQRWRERGRR